MAAVPDELEKLLGDVRKTINDNALFLKALVDDSVDIADNMEASDGEDETEEFEEL